MNVRPLALEIAPGTMRTEGMLLITLIANQ